MHTSTVTSWNARRIGRFTLALLALVAAPRTARAAPVLEQPVLLSTRGRVSMTSPELGTVRLSELTQLPVAVVLVLDQGARASGLCPDLTPFSLVGPTTAAPPCAAANESRALSPMAPLRAYVPPVVPRLIFPRATWVRRLDFIEWRRVPDREHYEIELLDEQSRVIWSATADRTQRIDYPTTAPRLEAGVVYSVQVRAGGDSSDTERAELGFRVLSQRGQAEVAKAEREISLVKESPRALKWLRALMLRRFQLRGEAAAQLQNVEDSAFLLELGNTYVALGLEQQAATTLARVCARAARESYEFARAAGWLRQLGFADRIPASKEREASEGAGHASTHR